MIQQVDVGGVLGNISNLETSALNRQNVTEQMASRKSASERANVLASAMPDALNGDQNALNIVAGADAELFMKMDKRARDIAGERAEDIATILQASIDHPDKWAEMRAFAIKKHGLDGSTIPEQYDQAFIDRAVGQVLGIGKMIEQANKRQNQDSYETILGEDGKPDAQRNVRTGEIKSDPRARKSQGREKDVFDKNGNIIGQRNTITNKYSPISKTTEKKPQIIKKNLPNGGVQDFVYENGEMTPFGEPKLNNAYEKEKRQAKEVINRVDDSLNRYREKLSRIGTELIPGQDKLDLQGSYRDLLLEMKELYNLGVLNGPDLEIMESILKDPTSISGNFYGGKNILNQLDTVVIPKLQASKERYEKNYGDEIIKQSSRIEHKPENDPLGLFE